MIFKNITEKQVSLMIELLKTEGWDEDKIFDFIYSLDCNMDED